MRIAVVGAGVAGSYLLNRLDGHEVECFEMRQQEKWYTVCAWGTSQPYIWAMVKKAGLNFDDYVLHKGDKMIVDYGTGTFEAPLKGLVSYDKHRLCEDMLKGHKVHWGTQVKGLDSQVRWLRPGGRRDRRSRGRSCRRSRTTSSCPASSTR